MTKYYLGTPATPVSPEWVFSAVGEIVCVQRTLHSGDNLYVLICWKLNPRVTRANTLNECQRWDITE